MAEPVAFIGLGAMGSALSSHLIQAGYAVTGYDTDRARLAEHAQRGGSCAASAAEAVAEADLVVTSLPSTAALWDVLRGDTGLAAQPRQDLLVVEASTLSVDVKEAARDFLAGHGKAMLDCPLSGTGAQARRKDVVAYVSGDQQHKDRAGPLLTAMTRGWYDVGAFGNGTRMKIIANLLVSVHNVAAAEALVLAGRAGLDLETVLAAVADGAGTSRMFEIRGPLMAAGDYTGPGISTRVFAKDLEIIDAFARDLDAPTPLFSLASTFYRAALAQGRDLEDTACVHAVLKRFASAPDERGTGGPETHR
jgi:3-hydroxyisobutyrate dehydrogenase-like beta-hydroxyacid dehydrogenase